jgi:hypothetical protein
MYMSRRSALAGSDAQGREKRGISVHERGQIRMRRFELFNGLLKFAHSSLDAFRPFVLAGCFFCRRLNKVRDGSSVVFMRLRGIAEGGLYFG